MSRWKTGNQWQAAFWLWFGSCNHKHTWAMSICAWSAQRKIVEACRLLESAMGQLSMRKCVKNV